MTWKLHGDLTDTQKHLNSLVPKTARWTVADQLAIIKMGECVLICYMVLRHTRFSYSVLWKKRQHEGPEQRSGCRSFHLLLQYCIAHHIIPYWTFKLTDLRKRRHHTMKCWSKGMGVSAIPTNATSLYRWVPPTAWGRVSYSHKCHFQQHNLINFSGVNASRGTYLQLFTAIRILN